MMENAITQHVMQPIFEARLIEALANSSCKAKPISYQGSGRFAHWFVTALINSLYSDTVDLQYLIAIVVNNLDGDFTGGGGIEWKTLG